MYAYEEKCVACGKKFIYRSCHKVGRDDRKSFEPICPDCRAEIRKRQEQESARIEAEIRKKQEEDEHREYLERLKTWDVVPLAAIRPENENVLYILGNGFDLMHRAKSSYYHFRDSMGKNNTLRNTLETYITVDNLWADFENALAHFDIAAMANEHVVDMWLDNFDAYKENSSAADYYLSVEASANPIATVVEMLPDKLRRWVNSLTIETTDRPLQSIFVNGGKVLNFNYTEFVEKLYDVPKQNVCYIHGCRVKQKGKPLEPLILGHMSGASDESFEIREESKSRLRGYKRAFVQMAQSNVIDYINQCDECLTKDTTIIIEDNATFFSGLNNVQTVISLGHSFSDTDWNYFYRIKLSIADLNNVKWYFGCYTLRDLDNLENLLNHLGLDKSSVKVFRTDTVVTTPLPPLEEKNIEKRITAKQLCKSKDGKWLVEKIGNNLYINSTVDNVAGYSITLPSGIGRAFFVVDDKCLFVVMRSVEPGVLLLKNISSHWKFIGEFHCDHQYLLNRRLRHVYITNNDITFVYNNRVRKYSLADCSVIFNKRVVGARNNNYDGTDIMDMFFGKSLRDFS